ncbi:MAG: MFS transporter, partial [Phaeodactylibacter sp.]|nr:MFS transporter [Phaeodactylibacter sp.]
SRSMAFVRLCISLGMTLAPVIGGFVAVRLGYNMLFWIDGLTCVLAALYLKVVTRTWKSREAARSEDRRTRSEALGPKPFQDRNYLLFLLATFIMGFAYIQWINTVPVFIKAEWGFHEGVIGTVLGVSSLIVVVFELALAHSIEHAGLIRFSSLIGLVMVGLSFMPFLLPKAVFLCFAAGILWTMGKMLFMPFNNAMPLNMSPPARRGEYMAWYWMTWALTLIAGPWLGLTLAEYVGFDGFWLFLGSLSLISLVMNALWAERILPAGEAAT